MKLNRPFLKSTFLAAGIIFSATLTFAQEKNVFLGYTQTELDRNYDQSLWAPNMKQVISRYKVKSDLTVARLGKPEVIAYGDTPIEKLALFRASHPKAAVEIFIHGGAWRSGKANEYLFPAEMFIERGVSYIALDFGTVQDIGLEGMAKQTTQAIAWIYKNAEKLGLDKERIYISGHSSGAHLGGVALTTDWTSLGLSSNPIKGAVLISGLFDLKGARLSARSSYVNFNDAIENDLSAIRHLDKIATPVILASGTLETDEFRRSSREFYQGLKDKGADVSLLTVQDTNHFEMMDDFANPLGLIGKAALAQTLGQ